MDSWAPPLTPALPMSTTGMICPGDPYQTFSSNPFPPSPSTPPLLQFHGSGEHHPRGAEPSAPEPYPEQGYQTHQ